MLTPAPSAVASPVKNAVRGSCVARTTAKIGASVDREPSISPLSAGCTRCRSTLRSTGGRPSGGAAPWAPGGGPNGVSPRENIRDDADRERDDHGAVEVREQRVPEREPPRPPRREAG